jgi:MFS family permease
MSARVTIATAAVTGAAALAGFALAAASWQLALALGLFGLSVGVAMTAAFTAGGAVIPPAVHSTGFGLLTGASLVGVAVSPVLSGLVGARNIRVVFVAGVVVLVVLALVVRRLMVERHLRVERSPAVEES